MNPEQKAKAKAARRDPLQWAGAALVAVVGLGLALIIATSSAAPPEDPPRDRTAEACAKAVGYDTSTLARCIATVDGSR